MKVHLFQEAYDSSAELLRKILPEEFIISHGGDDDLPDDYEILVSGRPSKKALEYSDKLVAAIIPWAGLPKPTWELLRNYPHLSVHNLHHNAPSTAETALALLLSAARNIVPQDVKFRNSGWPSLWKDHSPILLSGKSAMVMGYGEIGQRVGRTLKAMGLDVTGVKRSPCAPIDDVPIITMETFRESLAENNFLIICLPETEETTGIIGAEEIATLRKPSILVNIGRGPVVQEEAVFHALKNKSLDAAGFDVWWQYPSKLMSGEISQRPSQFPFHELPNVVMSPHCGGMSREDREMRMTALAELLINGKDQMKFENRVDMDAGY